MKTYTSSLPLAEVNNSIITRLPIDICALLKMAHHPSAGGVVLFSGEVRDNHLGKVVKYLEYEAYESMAEKMIRQIVLQAINDWKLEFAFCIHRIGKLEIGESAVAVVTAHAHRKESYEANMFIIDKVKHEAPIWKNEFYLDGTSFWGGHCHC